MRNIDLLKAINDIDDKYIEEATPLAFKEKKRISIFKYIPAFFGFMLIAVVGIKLINFNSNDNTMVVNPNVEYQTLKEAEKAVGFEFGVDLSDFDNLTYTVIDNEILEIEYEENGQKLICRKAKGNEDVSGDFNKYDATYDKDINGVNVTISTGTDNTLVTFNYDGYAYSFSSNYLDEYQMLNLLKQVIR